MNQKERVRSIAGNFLACYCSFALPSHASKKLPCMVAHYLVRRPRALVFCILCMHACAQPLWDLFVLGRGNKSSACTCIFMHTGAATGQVLYEGTTHVAGQPHTFEVAMEAEVTPHTPRANSHSHASHHHHSHTRHTSHGHRGSAPPPLRITAKRTRHRARAHHNAHHNAHANGHKAHTHAHGNSAAATQQPQAAALATAVATAETDAAHEVHDPTLEKLVGDELSRLFNSLTLDLQGVELSGPRLRLLDAGAAGQGASGEGALGAPELLEIHGTLRLVSIPPLNMQF